MVRLDLPVFRVLRATEDQEDSKDLRDIEDLLDCKDWLDQSAPLEKKVQWEPMDLEARLAAQESEELSE